MSFKSPRGEGVKGLIKIYFVEWKTGEWNWHTNQKNLNSFSVRNAVSCSRLAIFNLFNRQVVDSRGLFWNTSVS